MPEFEVSEKEVEGGPTVAITRRVTVDGLQRHIEKSLEELGQFLEQLGVEPDGPPVVIYHGEVNAEADGPVEVALPLPHYQEGTGHIASGNVPGGPVAYTKVTKRQAEFPTILTAYDAVAEWMLAHGYPLETSPREVFLADRDAVGPDDVLLEIHWELH